MCVCVCVCMCVCERVNECVSNLLLLALEVKDGRATWISGELAQVASTTGKIQRVSSDVVGQVSQSGVLPALLQSCLSLLLQSQCMERVTHATHT